MRIAVPIPAPVMLTGVIEPKLKVGGYCAPAGLEVMVAVSATLPVKPPLGVTVTVDVFPVVAAGMTETAVPVIEKALAGEDPDTVTTATFAAFSYVEELAASGVNMTTAVSVPSASELAGRSIVALPLCSAVAADV